MENNQSKRPHVPKIAVATLIRIAGYGAVYVMLSLVINKPAFPPISTIFTDIQDASMSAILQDFSATLLRWMVVFATGSVAGVTIAVLVGSSPVLHRAVKADIDFYRSLPATALIVFLLAIFGDGEIPRMLPAVYITFFTCVFYVLKQMAILGHRRRHHLQQLGASRRFILFHCLVYEIMPGIVLALRQSISLSFLVLISVELIIGPSGNLGVGGLLYDYKYAANYSMVLVVLLLVGFIGYLLNLLGEFGQRIALFWPPMGESRINS